MITWQDTARSFLETLEFKLSPDQEYIFYDEARIKLVGGGEGGGKSLLDALYCFCRSIHDYLLWGPSLYWIVAEDFEDAKKEAGGSGIPDDRYLIEFLDEVGVFDKERTSTPSKDKWLIQTKGDIRGHIYSTVSGYDPTKIGREQPRGIIGAEVGRWSEQIWNRCYGRLARRKHQGSWGMFSGSFESATSMWFQEWWNRGQSPNSLDIKSYSLPAWANPVQYPGGRSDPAILQLEAQCSPEYFMERYAGKPAPPRDAVLPEFNVKLHVMETPLVPSMPVYIFVDPGSTVYAVLFVQFIGNEVWVVDEVYAHQWSHEQVVQECMMRPAWKCRALEGHVIDIAGKQNHFGLGTPIEAWRRDTLLSFASQHIPVDTTVERVRSVLAISPRTGRPRIRISPKCQGLISELGGGPSPVPGRGVWKMKGGVPDRDKNCDAAKALGYGLVNHFGTTVPSTESGNGYTGSYLR